MAIKKSQESLRSWTKQKWRTSDGSVNQKARNVISQMQRGKH